jgi:hypothetical protein
VFISSSGWQLVGAEKCKKEMACENTVLYASLCALLTFKPIGQLLWRFCVTVMPTEAIINLVSQFPEWSMHALGIHKLWKNAYYETIFNNDDAV